MIATALAVALALAPQSVAAQLARLSGHQVTVSADGATYRIDSIAGEGAPEVGRVERRGNELWLARENGAPIRLIGRLARMRIAGPGYKVWVVGDRVGSDSLRARRLGVLAPPPPGAHYARADRRMMRATSGGAQTRTGGPQ